MKIYMISLTRDLIRREQMKKRFPRYYSQFHIIDAIDAKDEKNTTLIQLYDKPCNQDKRKPLTQGEKCCAISHLLALEYFLQSGYERCIIIEDDIIGTDTDFDVAIALMQKAKPDGLVVLGGQQGLKNSKYLVGSRIFDRFWQVPKVSSIFITRACCYSVETKSAHLILQEQKSCLTRSDFWAKYKRKITIYYSDIFIHPIDLSDSNLEKERSSLRFVSRLNEDGLRKILYRHYCKIIVVTLSVFKTYLRVSIKKFESYG